jgi:hypothetical protein
MLDGLKHFAVVGLGFGLICGWIATLVVNTALGALLEAILRSPPTKYYMCGALLAAVSIALIVLCIAIGNRLFRRWFAATRVSRSALVLSSALFLLVVLLFVVPQFGQVLSAYAGQTHYFYHHSSELLLMFSLPFARLLLLPAGYFFISHSALRGTSST